MGFFSKKESCSICGTELTKTELLDGYICNKCLNNCGNSLNTTKGLKNINILEVKEAIEKNREKERAILNFKLSKKIGTFIHFDDVNKKILFPKSFMGTARIYDYSNLLEYEILEDGDSITKGGLGRAVVGGLLFGGVGAIVGGVTGGKSTKRLVKKLQVKMVFNNEANPVEYINLLTTDTKSDSFVYKGMRKYAEDIVAELAVIANGNEKKEIITNGNSQSSEADEILKFKKLCEEGIITEEEFQAKKKQLLGL